MRLSLFVGLLCLSQMSFSADVLEAKRIKRLFARDKVELKVQYTGGCKDHLFSLKHIRCGGFTGKPVCEFMLMHDKQEDTCEMLVEKKITLKLPKVKKLRKAVWMIQGENETKVEVIK